VAVEGGGVYEQVFDGLGAAGSVARLSGSSCGSMSMLKDGPMGFIQSASPS
jgi:hypothetical protein